ncbi:metal-sensitive transcriptional regulator [Clostridium sp. DL1XJH146]
MSENNNKELLNRLRRIEGQVKGIERMVENDACCKDILVQVAAIRAAINKVGSLILSNYSNNCLVDLEEKDQDKVDELLSAIKMFIK